MNSQHTTQVTLLIITTMFFFIGELSAKQIHVSLPSKITANADFRAASTNKPAVLLVHGFMSTFNLNIIQIMADELEDEDYTILAPTLSLNINNRRAGADCDAVHSHSMEGDVKEIAWWVQWLHKKGYKQIVLVGFSTGALQVAAYLAKNNNRDITKVILVSPAFLAGEPFPQETEKEDIAIAENMLTNNKKQLHKFSLSYCKGNYLSPPMPFLSYKKWTIKNFGVPYSVIYGSNDKRFGKQLSEKLDIEKSHIITVQGANHFFDSPYEFEFLKKFIEALSSGN